MDPVDIMGWIAMIVTIVYTSYGLPVQFYKSHKTKSTEGLSLSMIIMMFMTFLSWVIYAAMKSPPDYYLIVCNSIGAVGAFSILIQFWMYRNSPHITK
jgi:MtN3 and saliva related transmembrane protein